MNTILLGQDVKVEFPLASGATAVSGAWWLEDASGALLQSETPFAPGDMLIGLLRVTVPGALNATPGLRVMRVRWVEPDDVLGEGGELAWRVIPAQELEIQVNSFQGYNQALDIASGMVGVDAFMAATRDHRVRALAEAWRHLVALRYHEPHLTHRQDRIRDVPWAGDTLSLEEVSPSEFVALDIKLVTALRRAQVVEADHLIGGGDSVEAHRRAGLMSSSVGEVSQFFRPGKPLQLAISLRALRELRGYASLSPRLGR
jgi:hypothetical protein